MTKAAARPGFLASKRARLSLTVLSPGYERERLWVLQQYGILDTPAEERFDSIVREAAQRFDMPIALVTLIDENRMWFKARIGLKVPEAERRGSFCSHIISTNAPLVLEDTLKNSAFSGSPFIVNYPYIRFYAGTPIRSNNGYPIGTLCLIDQEPRSFPWESFHELQQMGTLVEQRLEDRQAERERSSS